VSGTTLSSEGLDARRRRALFRCWHRGIREVDLIVGRYADAHLPAMSDADLTELERLLDVPDQQVLGWVTGEIAVPAEYDTAFFHRLRDFHLNAKPGG